MSAITFFENQDSILISCEEGRPLCSEIRPREEGLKWAYSLGSMPTDHVVIVGLGSGFHISALADLDPKIKISVIDCRESLLPVFESQFPELKARVEVHFIENANDILKTELFQDIITSQSFVVSFRECWGQQEEVFSKVFAHLTGRSLDSLNYHFENFGFDIKAQGLSSEKLLSIKEVLPLIEGAQVTEVNKQAFRVLGELVK